MPETLSLTVESARLSSPDEQTPPPRDKASFRSIVLSSTTVCPWLATPPPPAAKLRVTRTRSSVSVSQTSLRIPPPLPSSATPPVTVKSLMSTSMLVPLSVSSKMWKTRSIPFASTIVSSVLSPTMLVSPPSGPVQPMSRSPDSFWLSLLCEFAIVST